jgi:ribA/ribD-fused uncharacterized protein
MTAVTFYRCDEKPFGAFSNLYRRPILFGGRTFPTSEHAYQFAKPRRDAVRDWLMAAPSPGLLAMAAHGLYHYDIVPGWSKGKFKRMQWVLWAKFTQHRDLRDLLASTGDAEIIETGTVDNEVNRYWGIVNGRGKNTLGLLLMGVREDFRSGIFPNAEVERGIANDPWSLLWPAAEQPGGKAGR